MAKRLPGLSGRLASLSLLLALVLVSPCLAQESEEAALVTRLGEDTLSVEQWTRTPDAMEVIAAVRAPETTLRRYSVVLTPDGTIRRYEAQIFDPAEAEQPLRAETVEAMNGHWMHTVTEGGATETNHLNGDATLLPFVDLLFWPFELALLRTPDADTTTLPMLDGGRVLAFTLTRPDPNTAVITHPWRGSSTARIDAGGRLQALDASETTRKVAVTRIPPLDVEALARRWAMADQTGQGIGELSGRAEAQATVAGATLTVDYGTPSKRGRDIFGNVVPWGEVWRTGANRATHFTTDRHLLLGDPSAASLHVPPGTYTLFSIPDPEGGLLIVSRQTNQGGTSYDPARDLGRVPMIRSEIDEPVERFTIQIENDGPQRGRLRLLWDRTAFTIPFRVE